MAELETEKLKKLKAERAALEARIRQEQQRVSKAERSRDTHRKILVGSAALEAAKRDKEFSARLDAELKTFLLGGRTSRPSDFELFGFPVPANLAERKVKAKTAK